jgi:hypothetical protein
LRYDRQRKEKQPREAAEKQTRYRGSACTLIPQSRNTDDERSGCRDEYKEPAQDSNG